MTNRSLVVASDVDEVCLDLLSEWLRRYNLDYNDSKIPEDLSGWDLSRQTKAGEKFYEYLHDGDLYDHVKPLLGARNTIDAIRAEGHRVVFATSCNPLASIETKFRCLRRWGFLPHASDATALKDYFPVRDKSLVRADVLFDDALHNLVGFRGTAVLVEHPHNRNDITSLPRVRFSDTQGVLNILRSIQANEEQIEVFAAHR